MSNAFSTVACYEVAGSQQFDVSDTMTAKVTLCCTWANRYALVTDLLDNENAFPTCSSIYATSASIKPLAAKMTQDGQVGVYEFALVDVNYTANANDAFSEELAPNCEFVTLDYKRFRWSSGKGDLLLEGEAPGALTYSCALKRTYYNKPYVPAAVLTQIGHVNTSAYSSALLGVTFPAQTLLLQPGTVNRKVKMSGDGLYKWTINIAFAYKPQTWNKFFRAKTGTWESVYVADTGSGSGSGSGGPYLSYPLGDFSSLLS